MIHLKDHAEVLIPKSVSLSARKMVNPFPSEKYLPLVRSVQCGKQVQQGALSRATVSHNRKEFPGEHLQLEFPEYFHPACPSRVTLEEFTSCNCHFRARL
jgi:hypothetical protein